MRRAFFAVGLAAALLLVGSLVVLAQAGPLRLLQPAVVTISQAAPVQVTLGGIVGGQQVTLTAPMTMNVAVQVRLEGSGAVVTASAVQAAQPAQAAASTGASAGPVLSDPRGVAYRVDVAAPFQLMQVSSAVNVFDSASVVGEIRNAGTQEMQFVKAVVTFYRDGKIVQVGEGYTKLDRLAPGQSSPFEVMTRLDISDFNAYTVQADGRAVR
jgi:hypothetical protein